MHGIAASILDYLGSKVSREKESDDLNERTRWLKQRLVRMIRTGEADEYQLDPPRIQMSQPDRERAESSFLTRLQYDSMIDRERRIAKAHESTFQWVFQDSQSQDQVPLMIKWSNFRDWLISEDQIYWITGKAGSGKSTLMKFLSSPTLKIPQMDLAQERGGLSTAEKRCRCFPYLERWARPSRLLIASFYFWNSGMDIQMTRAGLLRTLLSQILVQRPDIISKIASKHWESLCLFDQLGVDEFAICDLRDMLFRAIKILGEDYKICLFIDGLDEFSDSHENLISMVMDLVSSNSHVKICVASRPWNIFQATLGQKASLRLEDLTFSDIKNFVQSKFHADTEFENLRQRYPSFADQMMENIVVKASGVFLWVDLVVASLLAGMRLGDRIQDFQRRLDELPEDLEKLYEKILHSLDPFYLGHAAQYFTMVESANVPLTILQFTYADEETPESAFQMVRSSNNENQISLRIEGMSRRLNSRCKGFLEIERGLQSLQGLPSQLTIQYLHRTVRDYIKSPKAQKFLQSSTNPDFDPSLQLCIAYLMDTKTWYDLQEHMRGVLDEDGDFRPSENIIHCLRHASSVTAVNETNMTYLLDELKAIIKHPDYWQRLVEEVKQPTRDGRGKSFIASTASPSIFPLKSQREGSKLLDFDTCKDLTDNAFLSLAVSIGVVPYVKARAECGGLVRRPTTENPEERFPLLLVCLYDNVPEPKMVECLLDLGADPTFRWPKSHGQTPWTLALTKVTTLYTLKNEIADPAEYLIAENKWRQTLRLLFSRGGSNEKVPEPLLSPLSRKLLQELKDEVGPEMQPFGDFGSWFSIWS